MSKINGHELETKYLVYIQELKMINNDSWWKFLIPTRRYKRLLRERLEKLGQSYEDGFLSARAYKIYEKMIKEVL